MLLNSRPYTRSYVSEESLDKELDEILEAWNKEPYHNPEACLGFSFGPQQKKVEEEEEEEEEFEVKDIVGCKYMDGILYYCIQWKLDDSYTWEPEKNLIHCNEILENFKRKQLYPKIQPGIMIDNRIKFLNLY